MKAECLLYSDMCPYLKFPSLRLMGYYGGWSVKPQLGLSNAFLGPSYMNILCGAPGKPIIISDGLLLLGHIISPKGKNRLCPGRPFGIDRYHIICTYIYIYIIYIYVCIYIYL